MKKECPICHASVDDTAVVCPNCGATLSTEVGWEDPAFWTNPAPTSVNGYPSSAAKGLSIALAVFCFIAAGAMLLTLLLSSVIGRMIGELDLQVEYAEQIEELLEMSIYSWPFLLSAILDIGFYLVFGILLLVKKSWKIALTIAIYSSIGYVLTMIGGSFPGIPTLAVLGILCTIWLRKAPEAQNNFFK